MGDTNPASLWARVRLLSPALILPPAVIAFYVIILLVLKADGAWQLIIAPLTFLSFLLSLSLIDSYTTSRLSPSTTPPTMRQRITNVIHRALFKQNPSYKYPGVGQPTKPKITGEKAEIAKKAGEHWYWHTHQRKLMRMEVDDAFRIRRWVLWGMGAVAIVLICLGLWVGGKVVGVVMERVGGKEAAFGRSSAGVHA